MPTRILLEKADLKQQRIFLFLPQSFKTSLSCAEEQRAEQKELVRHDFQKLRNQFFRILS
jgi:hypothetical protein